MRKVTIEVDDSVAAALCLFLKYLLDKGPHDMMASSVGPHVKTVVTDDPDIGEKLSELHEQLRQETRRFALSRIIKPTIPLN